MSKITDFIIEQESNGVIRFDTDTFTYTKGKKPSQNTLETIKEKLTSSMRQSGSKSPQLLPR
ncbi:MAG: hypothetical protein NZ824_12125 [Candidatus Thioglobus sp.]|nr:hypothetical protein [Candidatus Thioglobus sp.]